MQELDFYRSEILDPSAVMYVCPQYKVLFPDGTTLTTQHEPIALYQGSELRIKLTKGTRKHPAQVRMVVRSPK